MLITKELLVFKKACSSQVALFEKTFPSGAKVTKKNCLVAVKVGLGINWAANNLLTESQRKIYYESLAPSLEIYKESAAPSLEIYKESAALAFYNAYKQS